jgi:hypothetical protein
MKGFLIRAGKSEAAAMKEVSVCPAGCVKRLNARQKHPSSRLTIHIDDPGKHCGSGKPCIRNFPTSILPMRVDVKGEPCRASDPILLHNLPTIDKFSGGGSFAAPFYLFMVIEGSHFMAMKRLESFRE